MIRTELKIVFVALTATFMALVSSSSYAQTIGAANTYDVTVTKVELCSSAACGSPIVVGNGSKQFDIASGAVGAELGSYASLSTVPKGTSITHVRVTMSRSIGISGSLADPGNMGGPCSTNSANASSTTTTAGIGVVGGAGTTQTLVVPDELSIAGQPAAGTYAAQDLTLLNATEMQVLKALPGPFVMGDVPPVVDIAFETSAGLMAFDSDGAGGAGNCLMLPGAPVVRITKK